MKDDKDPSSAFVMALNIKEMYAYRPLLAYSYIYAVQIYHTYGLYEAALECACLQPQPRILFSNRADEEDAPAYLRGHRTI